MSQNNVDTNWIYGSSRPHHPDIEFLDQRVAYIIGFEVPYSWLQNDRPTFEMARLVMVFTCGAGTNKLSLLAGGSVHRGKMFLK